MATSIVCIVVCMMCLASLTWAWYSASVQSSNNTLVAASFVTKTEVFNVTDPNNKHEVDISDPLPAGKYEVTVTQLGTSKVGYCLIKAEGSSFYAGEFKNVEGKYKVNIELEIVNPKENGVELNSAAIVDIVPVWGIYNGDKVVISELKLTGTEAITASIGLDEETTAQESETTASEAETTAPETTVETEDTTSDITTSDTTTSEPGSTDSESTATDTDAAASDAASDEEGAEEDTTETTGPEESISSPEEETTTANEEPADDTDETTTATETSQEQITE